MMYTYQQRGTDMQLTKLNPNMTEVSFGETTVLFSYNTPVAYTDEKGNHFKTDKKWSNTTSKHINKWLAGEPAQLVNQSVLDNLIK